MQSNINISKIKKRVKRLDFETYKKVKKHALAIKSITAQKILAKISQSK